MSVPIDNAINYLKKREGDIILSLSEGGVESAAHNHPETIREYKLYSVYGTISFRNGEILTKEAFLDKFHYGETIEDFEFYELSDDDAISKIKSVIVNEFSHKGSLENVWSYQKQISEIDFKKQTITKFEEIQPDSFIFFEFKHLIVKVLEEKSLDDIKRKALFSFLSKQDKLDEEFLLSISVYDANHNIIMEMPWFHSILSLRGPAAGTTYKNFALCLQELINVSYGVFPY